MPKVAIDLIEPFEPLKTSYQKYLVLYGGSNSGKSYAAAQYVIACCMREPRSYWLICRQAAVNLKSSVFPLTKSILKKHRIYFEERLSSPLLITIPQFGSTLHFTGLDDVDKLKSLPRLTSIWLEEPTEIQSPETLDQLTLRFRGETQYPNQVLLTFNPVSQYHWLNQRFFSDDVADADKLIIKTTYRDNPHVTADARAFIEQQRTTNPNFYAIYGLGEWGKFEGQIYGPFQVGETAAKPDEVFYGLDFGYTDPTALVEVRRVKDSYYVKQLIYATNLTAVQLREAMRAMNIAPTSLIYCDGSRPEIIKEMVQGGFSHAKPAQKDVFAGINKVLELKKSIFVHPSSADLIREAELYSWKPGTSKMVPRDGNDHALDALRYSLYTHGLNKYNIAIR